MNKEGLRSSLEMGIDIQEKVKEGLLEMDFNLIFIRESKEKEHLWIDFINKGIRLYLYPSYTNANGLIAISWPGEIE